MQKGNNFQVATVLFYEAKYEEALRAISNYLEVKPRSSMGFNNRGLIHLYMGNFSMAKEDIETSLQLNHLNYVAYFNLFSVYSREKDYESSLFALRGALSSLYLIKGRLLKEKHFLSKSIEQSTNNIDAILLLTLLEVRDGHYDQALVLVEAAKTLKQNLRILQKMGVFAEQLQSNYSTETEEALFDYLIEAAPVHSPLSGHQLQNKTMLQQQLRESIDEKVLEFNQLYNEINKSVGGASYLIAKTSDNQQEGEQEQVKDVRPDLLKKKEIMALQEA